MVLDDATTEVYYAQLSEQESTQTVMAALQEVVERKGVFCSLYLDRGSHFFYTPQAGQPPGKHHQTQIEAGAEDSPSEESVLLSERMLLPLTFDDTAPLNKLVSSSTSLG